ncbi:S41 family peptidase [Alteromonas halophila]|uniref:S41 family peptidase n=1 Tax=Alteromonas halophila TaxID=516698 RepID=UPI00167B5052|nr:S41 family peptidase [Alteromonas halophila]
MRAILFIWLVLTAPLTLAAMTKAPDKETLIERHEVSSVIQQSIDRIRQYYLLDEKVPDITRALEARLQAGDFDRQFQFGHLRQQLEHLLHQASGDNGFTVLQRPGIENDPAIQPLNYPGTIETRTLSDRVGVISLTGDIDYDHASEDISDAMRAVAGCRALVIDLSRVARGSITAVHHMLSHFHSPGAVLGELCFAGGRTEHLTASPVTNAVAPATPVYIVNSAFVNGSWEWFSYLLGASGNVTIVGERTMGVAVLPDTFALSEHVSLRVPRAVFAHPVSGDNWHDWGVDSDYQTDNASALAQAIALAEKNI